MFLYRIECKKVCVCLTQHATASGSLTHLSYCFWTRKIFLKRRSRSHLSPSAFQNTLVCKVRSTWTGIFFVAFIVVNFSLCWTQYLHFWRTKHLIPNSHGSLVKLMDWQRGNLNLVPAETCTYHGEHPDKIAEESRPVIQVIMSTASTPFLFFPFVSFRVAVVPIISVVYTVWK